LFRTALTDFFSGHGKSLAYVGTALALTGAGTATIAAASSPAPVPGIASSARNLGVGDDAGSHHGATIAVGHPAASTAVTHKSAGHKAAAHHAVAHKAAAHKAAAHKTGAHKTGAQKAVTHEAVAHHAAKRARVHVVRHSHRPTTWKQVRDALASQTFPKAAPGKLPLADRLLPGSASGPQAYLPVTSSRMANATTIVRQTLGKHMGIRAAVIAVATAMQESTLENINYGDRDSLGLFQQRPSAGWGTPAQITTPSYAADAFLNALHAHQQADPEWASQPLWETAQAVQVSGFPYAYAKWESQAAQLVAGIARHMS
jgi:hypothetical protein